MAELAASNGKGIAFIIIKGGSVRFGSARHTHIDVDRISCFEILSLLGQRIAASAGRSCCRSICLEIKFDMQTFSHIFPPFRLVESCERISILVTFDSNSSCRRWLPAVTRYGSESNLRQIFTFSNAIGIKQNTHTKVKAMQMPQQMFSKLENDFRLALRGQKNLLAKNVNKRN